MTARVIALASVAPVQRDYERMCELRRRFNAAWSEWIAGPDAPTERDVQAELFGSFAVLAQTVEMLRPYTPPIPSPFAQGEDWGDVCDAPALGVCDARGN